MIQDKAKAKRPPSCGGTIHCHDCSISQLCIPFSLNTSELDLLDSIIERKKPIQKGETLFKAGDELKSLFAIRSGTVKSYTITEQGDEQITGFHLAGDLVGFDAVTRQYDPSFAQALETSMVCEIPYEVLDELIYEINSKNLTKPVLLDCHWFYHPSLTYHINQKYRGVIDLVPYHKETNPKSEALFYYSEPGDADLLSENYSRIKEFAGTYSILWKKK